MSALCLVIKKEPEEPTPMATEDAPTSHSESEPIQTEFVNIKMEMDVEIPTVRVKQEPQFHGPSSPQEPDSTQPSYQHSGQNINPWKPTEIEDHSRNYSPDQSNQSEDTWQPSLFTKNAESWYRPVKIEPVDISIESIPIEYEGNNVNDAQPTTNNISKDNASNITKEGDANWTCTPDGKFACTLCSKTYSTNGNFQRHFLVHSQSPLQCKHCSKNFTTLAQLQRHVKVHGTYNCEECGKVFKTSSNLFQHKRVHLSEKPFKCPLCGKDFTVRANLMKHQGKSRCKKYTGPITCHVCRKEFKTEFLLKSHLRRHTTEKPFSCDLCDMNFKYKSTLIRHIQVHNGVRPYSCEVCNKSFTHISLLKPHMRIHTGEKPYKCPICSKMFAHKHNMERHTLRHSREKKTTCEICNKKFPKESRLKYHMRTHINEKHFRCFVCPKKFSHRQNVLRHYTRKHPNATYDCTDTDAKIATKLWEEVLNKKITLTDKTKDNNEKVVANKLLKQEVSKDVVLSETDEILPDLDRPSVKETAVSKKKKLTQIVAALSEKIAEKHKEKNGNDMVLVKNETSDEDSDDEVLAKMVVKSATNLKLKPAIENVGNEKLVVSNESVEDGYEINVNNLEVTIKKEVVSDEEVILPDSSNKTDNLSINIKEELEPDLNS